MKMLVEGLASMSGLRDREALDFAFVRLVANCASESIVLTSLLRVVGEDDDRRCLACARLDAQMAQPECDAVWMDWTALPKLADSPYRQQAFLQSKCTQSGVGPYYAVFPVGGAQGVWAVLEVQSRQPLPASTLEMIESIVLTYQNLLGLLDYGEKDALTELLNRKTFDGAFFKAAAQQNEEVDSERPDRREPAQTGRYWLAMLDIDHFKRVNDTFGHLIGDEVLLLMARLMRANFRFHDQLYRFGGEEFVVLMRCDSSEDAHVALERLRRSVQAYAFPQVGEITVSIGYSALQENDTPSGAFGRADKAVYYAKAHGRNMVCSYQDLVQAGELVEQASEAMDVDLF